MVVLLIVQCVYLVCSLDSETYICVCVSYVWKVVKITHCPVCMLVVFIIFVNICLCVRFMYFPLVYELCIPMLHSFASC